MGYDNILKDVVSSTFGGNSITNVKTIQELIPLKQIINGMIITNDNRYLKIIEVEPTNFMLKEPSEQDYIAGLFTSWLRVAPAKMQFKVSVRQKSKNEYIEGLKHKREMCIDPMLIRMYDNIIEYAQNVVSRNAIERRHFVIFEFEPGRRDQGKELSYNYISAQLDNTISQAAEYFNSMGNSVVWHKDENAFLQELIYEECNPRTSEYMSFNDRARRIVNDTDMLNEKRAKEGKEIINLEYVNLIAPMGMSTKTSPETVIFDNTYHAYYYIPSDGYPITVNTGWLTNTFANIPGIDIDFFVRKINRKDFLSMLGQQMKFTRLKANDRSDLNKDYNDIVDAAESQQYMMDALSDRNNIQDPYYVSTILSISAPTFEELEDKCIMIEEIAVTSNLKIVPMARYEHMGLPTILPFNNVPPKIWYKARRNITTDGLAGFYPFTEYELNDPDGLLMGISIYNKSICSLNLYNRNKYSNANMCIFGGSGSGKTYTMSLLADRLVLDGKQVYIITSEKGHEFRRICQALNGTFVKFASSENKCLNIFDIRPESEIKDVLFQTTGSVSWLAKKVASISGWLQLLFKNMTEDEKIALEHAIKATYAKRGITDNNDSIFVDNDRSKPLKEMPLIEDLLEEVKLIDQNPDTRISPRIISMLTNFVSGPYSKFNAHTNIDLSEDRKIIVFDLEDISTTIESATIQLALDFIWGRVKEDPTKQKTIIIEEGWKYLSAGASDASAKLIQEIFKVIRGYGGNVILATQEIGDLCDSPYGRSIIECSALKILMGVEEGASRRLQMELNLLPSEAKALETYRKGACLLLAGKDHIPIQVQASPLEHSLISTDINDYAASYEALKNN